MADTYSYAIDWETCCSLIQMILHFAPDGLIVSIGSGYGLVQN